MQSHAEGSPILHFIIFFFLLSRQQSPLLTAALYLACNHQGGANLLIWVAARNLLSKLMSLQTLSAEVAKSPCSFFCCTYNSPPLLNDGLSCRRAPRSPLKLVLRMYLSSVFPSADSICGQTPGWSGHRSRCMLWRACAMA